MFRGIEPPLTIYLRGLALFPLFAFSLLASPPLPENHTSLSQSTTFAQMEAFLGSVDGKGPVQVGIEGKSTQGRSLYSIRLLTGPRPAFRILFYAQQHGDEVSGKDALLYLIRDIFRNPALLPRDVDLWIMPLVNPDGAEAGTRKNGAGADLNRDHMVLEQPETQALHALARRVRPHLAVDAHEFSRDSESYRDRGLEKWPDITMDGLNNPLFDPRLIRAAQRWVHEAARVEKAAGHRFLRYWVGGAPPDEEQRHSAMDIDGGLNAMGMYGSLSFIIEAAVRHKAKDPSADLGQRVDAYLVLFKRFLTGAGRRKGDLEAVEKARVRPLPSFLPVDAIWVNPGMKITSFPVVDLATGRTLEIQTANLMTELAVKKAVPTPLGYAVEPRAAGEFSALLKRHEIPFETLAHPKTVTAESCQLVRVEDEFDEVYNRYGGRQIVRRQPAAGTELPFGTLWVPLAGESAVRAALVLEPAAMYGLYQYPRFRALVNENGSLPVFRVVKPQKRGETRP